MFPGMSNFLEEISSLSLSIVFLCFFALITWEGKASACNAGDPGSIPGSRISPGEGNGNPLQYSYLGNPMDRGVEWSIVHGAAKESDMT